MPEDNINNKIRPRSAAFQNIKPSPRISLSLHTMPQTSTSHFKRWLVLGFCILVLIILFAFLVLEK